MHNVPDATNLVAQDAGLTPESLADQRQRLETSIMAIQVHSGLCRKALMTGLFTVASCVFIGLISPMIERSFLSNDGGTTFASNTAKFILLGMVVLSGLFAAAMFTFAFRGWYILRPILETQRHQVQIELFRHLQNQIEDLQSQVARLTQ